MGDIIEIDRDGVYIRGTTTRHATRVCVSAEMGVCIACVYPSPKNKNTFNILCISYRSVLDHDPSQSLGEDVD